MKINLSVRVFFFNILLLAALFSGTYVYYMNQEKQELKNELINKSQLLIKTYKTVLLENMTNYNDIALMYNIENMESIENVNYVVIVDSHGVVLGHSDVYEIGKTYTDPLTKWTVGVKDFSYKKILKNDTPILVCAYPLTDIESGVLGYIQIGLATDAMSQAILEKQNSFLIFVGVFSSVYMVIFLIFFILQIVHPLNMIKDGVSFMSKNISKFKFKIKSKNEIGDIYNNINNLIDSINTDIGKYKNFEDNINEVEQKKLENMMKIIFNNSYFLIADNDNKIIFSNIPEDKSGKVIGVHVIDVFKDSDVMQVVADSYSNKGKIFETKTNIFDNEYLVKAFVIQGDHDFADNKTVIIFTK